MLNISYLFILFLTYSVVYKQKGQGCRKERDKRKGNEKERRVGKGKGRAYENRPDISKKSLLFR